MTVSTEKTVWCDDDDCMEFVQISGVTSNREVRKQARRRGWACHSGGDFCPTHNTK